MESFKKISKVEAKSILANSNIKIKLKNNKYLNCHICDSQKIEKTLMAPNILNSSDLKIKDTNKIKEIKSKLREFKKFNKVLFCPSLIIAADKIIWEIWLKFPSILCVSAIVIALSTEPCAMKDIIKLSRIKTAL